MPAQLIPGMVCADCGGWLRRCNCIHESPRPHAIHDRPNDHDARPVTVGTYLDAYLRELPPAHANHAAAVAMLTIPPGHAVSVGQATADRSPHSRACGIRMHEHGPECFRDCPTCHGTIDQPIPPGIA